MMSWNYRIMKRAIDGVDYFDIHEVYYRKDGTIAMWSEDAISPFGETIKELKKDFSAQRQAFKKPILDYDQLVLQYDEKRRSGSV